MFIFASRTEPSDVSVQGRRRWGSVSRQVDPVESTDRELGWLLLRSLKSNKEGKIVQAKNTGQSKEGTRPRRRHPHLGGSGALDSAVASKPRSVWISAGDFLQPVRGSKLKFWGI